MPIQRKNIFFCSVLLTSLMFTACTKQENTTPATQTNTTTVDTSQPLASQAVAVAEPSESASATVPTTIPPATVSQLAQLPDDSLILLQGQLIKDLGDEKYLFRDSTGEVVVEIDKELWIGGGFVANENVALQAKIDVEASGVKVDVERFQATIQ